MVKPRIVRYNSPGDFERDAEKRLNDGWTIQGQTQERARDLVGDVARRKKGGVNRAIIRSFFMMPGLGAAIGPALAKPKPGPITVTWVKTT
jgi:hypothetical protein